MLQPGCAGKTTEMEKASHEIYVDLSLSSRWDATMTLRICIGYDYRESIAYHVLAHSIMRRASGPVSIQPIMLSQFHAFWDRPRSPMQSTDFTFARFLTPWLAGDGDISGVSIFMDCDMLCLDDIYKILPLCEGNHDVYAVQHDYTPLTKTKFLNQPQSAYPCKNWSSFMVFNGNRMRTKDLTPTYVNRAQPMDLHQFKWADSIGNLPPEWNHLVGEYPQNPNAKLVHYTLGGPYFFGDERCEYSEQWYDELKDMLHRDNPSFHLDRIWL